MRQIKYNIGILGAANIAKKAMIPAILELSNFFNLYGVASKNNEKLKNIAKIFQTRLFDSYEKLLEDKNVNIVYIPLPNSLHFYWAKKAIENNLHVLVEKTLACTYDEVLELNDLAKKKELVIIESFQFRFHNQIELLQKIISTGKIGKVRSIYSCFGFPPFQDKTNIRYQKNLGGGALLDAGVYPIKIAQIFLGRSIKVTAAKLSIENTTNVDIFGGGFIEEVNGDLFLNFSFGFDNYYQNSIEIWGSLGKIRTNRIFTAPVNYKPEIEVFHENKHEIVVVDADDHFKKILLHFHNCILNKTLREEEYLENISQSKLLNEFKTIINEK